MIGIYEVNDEFVEYLRKYDSRVLSPKINERTHTRKYVGVLLHNKDIKYFVPLSSYKSDVHESMYESKSFKKIGKLAVLRINNMIPVDDSVVRRVNFNDVMEKKYRDLLRAEYRIIKTREKEIRLDARIVYFYRLNEDNQNKGLYKICCDYKLLEEKMLLYLTKKD